MISSVHVFLPGAGGQLILKPDLETHFYTQPASHSHAVSITHNDPHRINVTEKLDKTVLEVVLIYIKLLRDDYVIGSSVPEC